MSEVKIQSTKPVTENGEPLTKFKESKNKRTPIQAAYEGELPGIIGRCFLLNSGGTETFEEVENNTKVEKIRAVYEVSVISKKAELKLGTNLTVKIKYQSCIVDDTYNTGVLLGTTKKKVIVFDELMHWLVNGTEGLSAKGARLLDDVSPQDAMNL